MNWPSIQLGLIFAMASWSHVLAENNLTCGSGMTKIPATDAVSNSPRRIGRHSV